jgi:hypothetical protein
MAQQVVDRSTDTQSAKEAQEIIKGPHIYDPIGRKYVRVAYEHQEYPKCLYHPSYGSKPAPSMNDYPVHGGMTDQQQRQVLDNYNAAVAKWQRSNRIKIVNSKADEARLIKKGWVVQMPKPFVSVVAADDEEI